MKTNFIQIYDKTAKEALDLMYNYSDKESLEQNIKMPKIDNPDLLLEDIYNSTNNSQIMKWILSNAEIKK